MRSRFCKSCVVPKARPDSTNAKKVSNCETCSFDPAKIDLSYLLTACWFECFAFSLFLKNLKGKTSQTVH